MKPVSRRTFLKSTGAVAAAAVSPQAYADGAQASGFDHVTAKLYDATRCIGCRRCLHACREANNLPPEPGQINGIDFDMPQELSPNNWMVIQAYKREPAPQTGDPGQWSFIKKNCMHCNVPACVSACPVAALEKTDAGPVVYHEQRCIGCRYCLLACPFQVPRYEWVDRTPRVRKCILRLNCVHACPVGALQTGTRREMLDEAHDRIRREPDRYIDHVYGEQEAGGTSYLILSGVPLELLGLPDLPTSVRSGYADALMGSLPGLMIGLGLFLGGMYQLEKRQRDAAAQREAAVGGGSHEP